MTSLFNPTIARITARALLGRRKFLLLLPLPLLVMVLAFAVRSFLDPTDVVRLVLVAIGLAVVLPVLSLIVGSGVLGSEIDDGTLTHIISKPLPRREIIITKVVVAAGITAVVTGIPMALTGLVVGSASLAVGLAVGIAVGSLAYCALFVALSLLTRHPVLIGLLYIIVWESILTNLLSGARTLSIFQYTVTLVDRVSASGFVNSNVSLAVSLAMAFIFIAGFTLLAIDRLRSFTVQGETS